MNNKYYFVRQSPSMLLLFFNRRYNAWWVLTCQSLSISRFNYVFLFSFGATASPPPTVGHGLLIHQVSRSHTTTHYSRQDFSGRGISSSRRPLPDNTQHSQQTNIHAPGGIRTHNLGIIWNKPVY